MSDARETTPAPRKARLRGLAYRLLQYVGRFVEPLTWQFVIRANPHRQSFGLRLVDCASYVTKRNHTADFFKKFEQALKLFSLYDPHSLTRVRRYLTCIVLIPEGAGHYLHRHRAYITDLNVLHNSSVGRIAAFIVHEATHARLACLRVCQTEERQPRVETLCVANELVFASRLPEPDALLGEIRRSLDAPWWSDEKLQDRARRRLRGLGVPEWVTDLVPRRSTPRSPGTEAS